MSIKLISSIIQQGLNLNPNNWILKTGLWNDSGIWDDTKFWID